MPKFRPADERFWEKVDKTATCWLWTATRSGNGYGNFAVTHFQRTSAHRFAYEQAHGPVPEGKDLDHLCRVRACVNPDHLEVVTHRVNSLRGVSPWADRARQTHCIHGHPFDEANTYIDPKHPTIRKCRACHRTREAAKRAKASQLGNPSLGILEVTIKW